MELKISIHNRHATFDYEILKRYEAGVVLLGSEVKAIQAGQVSLAGSAVFFKAGRPVLLNADIAPYQPLNMKEGYNRTRDRQLLLSKSEMEELFREVTEKKLTIVPISMYNKGSLIKVEIGLARKRKKSDKREAIKKRETKREIKTVMG